MAGEPPRHPGSPAGLSGDLGPYQIEEKLGAGGMGEVYRAFDTQLRRRVAIKVIRGEAGGAGEVGGIARERLRREARAAAALDHPATVRIHEILTIGDHDAIVMELVDGTSLAALLRRGPLDPERAVSLGIEIAEGLGAAHALGIVHRDLKPENVMVTPAGHAKILDFGLAKGGAQEAGAAALSRDGAVVGTFRSMSPEQARGLSVDARSDLFSLGTLLYEAATGCSPFQGETVLETLTNICVARQIPAHGRRAEVPPALSAVIDQLLEKQPIHRPQSAREAAAALAASRGPLAGSGTGATAARAPHGAATAAADTPTLVDGPPLATGSGGGAALGGAPLGGAVPAADSRRGPGPPASPSSPEPLPSPRGPEPAPSPRGREPAAGPGAEPGTTASGQALPAHTPRPSGRRTASALDSLAPRGRHRTAGLGLALLTLVAAVALAWLGLLLLRQHRQAAEPLAVAVLAPSVAAQADTDPAAADALAASTRAALLRGLVALRGIAVIPPEQVDPVAGSPVQVARATAADEVVTASLSCATSRCRVTLTRLAGADGRRRWEYSFDTASASPYDVAGAAEAQIHLGYPDHAPREELRPLAVGAADYRDYLEVHGDFTRRRGAVPTGELLTRLERVRQRSPRFLEAAVLEAELLRYRFHDRRDAADLDRAFAVLLAARQLAPAEPAPLASDFSLALEAERLDRAAADLAALEKLQPGDPAMLAKRAMLLERRGDTAQALALAREACRRRPSWSNLMSLGFLEYRLGQSAAARRDLELLLRRAPGFYQAQSLLAQIELLSGSPARAAELYADLVRRSPQESEVINLGTACMLLRRYPEAEQRFRQALAIEPRNPFVTLNLADVRLLQGDRPGAVALYRRLLTETALDPVADQWQLVSARAQALAHLGERLAAVAAAQRVLALAPGNAQAQQEVSLIYAIVGDQASALWNAEQALRQGVDPRWFSFPWFDALRAAPELRPLLAARPPA